jgi:hypothetical protein
MVAEAVVQQWMIMQSPMPLSIHDDSELIALFGGDGSRAGPAYAGNSRL